MRALQKNLKWLDKNGKTMFWSLVCSTLLMTACYVYLINTTTRNGIEWGKAEQTIASLGGSVSELESTYLSLKQTVTLSLAYAKGFQDVKAVRFITEEKVGTVASASAI